MFFDRQRDYYSVAALAAAALLLEGSLTRFLAVAQFYHFAFLVVSLALLGFGASGSLLSLFPHWYEKNRDQNDQDNLGRLFILSGIGFATSIGLLYLTVNLLPFDSYSIAWERRQIFFFILYYLVLTIPFIFAGLGIGGVLSSKTVESNLVYAINLFGSAFGILLALFVMHYAGVPGALLASALIGLSVGIIHYSGQRKTIRITLLSILSLGCVLLGFLVWINLTGSEQLFMNISPYKGLAYARRIPGSDNLYGRWNAISRVDIIARASTRVMPGLSYTYNDSPPEQIGMALDADALQPITQVHPGEFEAAEYLPETFVFHINPDSNVLVIEPGGGLGILQALSGNARQVTGIVSNPLILKAMEISSTETDPFHHLAVQAETETSRVYLESDGDDFDIIFLPLTDSYRPVASGAYSLTETYNLTIESFRSILSHLSDGGVFVLTRWLQTPPSEGIRAVATVIEALESMSIEFPEEKFIAYRGIQTLTILTKPSGWSESELIILREFVDSRRFDLVWAPNIHPDEINRYNRLPEPIYYLSVINLLTHIDRQEFYSDNAFAIQPATDDHPFFFHFFKWEQTPEIVATLGRVWQPFGGSGYFVLLALLILVSALSFFLILVPVLIKNRKTRHPIDSSKSPGGESSPATQWRVFLYFGSIGLAFLFIEIPLIQRGMLFFGHPIYAFTVVVITILLFSSLGSLISYKDWIPKKWVVILLVALALITPLLIKQFQPIILGKTLPLRIILFVTILAPLGLLMGMPFPFGLKWLERTRTELKPWAWAVNGCASVVAAVLAAILALSYGFTLVFIFGAFFYGIAAAIAISFSRRRPAVSDPL